jgi:AcrR family transcriptional regulator
MAGVTSALDRGRDPARTREAILDAAERLFAEHGYDSTSLQEVGAMAGVSRATPGYFFGSKAELHRAVLERCFANVRQAVRDGRERARISGREPEDVLVGVVSDYFDFITTNPNFVRLIEWEALSGGRQLQDSPHLEVAQEALAAVQEEIDLEHSWSTDAVQLLLSVIALCWFPLVHAATLSRALGVDPGDRDFLESRKRHVVELVLNGIQPRVLPLPTT